MNMTAFVAGVHWLRPELSARKRVADAIFSTINQLTALLLLLVLSPLLLFITYLIWRKDGAPVLFGHFRVGCDGRLFVCMKFRTMLRDSEALLARHLKDDGAALAEWTETRKLTKDPRITAVGRFLRRSSLDELPQLLNVLHGDMNLVGPRPITVSELDRYGAVRWHYLSIKPGMTGLWQVSGRNNRTYEERVELDRSYVEERSVTKDMIILVRTIRVVVRRDGAR